MSLAARFERARRALSTVPRALPHLPPYPAASVAAWVLLCAAETAAVPGPLTLGYGLWLPLLGLPLSAALGLLVQLALLMVPRIAGRLTPAVWLLGGLSLGHSLADALGAFGRLGTRYDLLAKMTLGGCTLAGLSAGALLMGVQPSTKWPRGRLLSLSGRWRWPLSLLLVAASAALTLADHTMYVGLYVQAHVALRAGAWAALTVAVAMHAGLLRLPVLRWRAAVALLLALLLPVLLMGDDDADTVQAFATRPWPATTLRMARAVFDLDRDGFSAVLAGGDCDDFDADINPGAREIPQNGIDDNCVFGDRGADTENDESVPVPDEPSPVNVVLVSIDTLRADRLTPELMPELSAWSERGVRFAEAYTPGAWTSIALASTQRGRLPRRLQWHAYHETSFYRMLRDPEEGELLKGEKLSKLFPLAWDDPHEPLQHWLKRRGMKTAAVVDDGFSQMLARAVGADRGFDSYREVNVEPNEREAMRRFRKRRRGSRSRDDATTTTLALSALRWTVKNARFFLWVHYFGPHTPSTSHAGVEQNGDSLEAGYDHEVRFVDRQLGRLLQAIDEIEEPTAVFVTSDHGEKFFGRYRSHGADLSEEVLRVPLVARVPGWLPRTVTAPVTLLDLMPTILRITHTPGPSGLDGIDLTPLAMGAEPEPRVLLSDTWQFGNDGEPFNDRVAAYDGRRKVILDRIEHSFRVYDQTRPDAPPLRIQSVTIDRYARSILGYLEESGGRLLAPR
ncbi:MAG: sulfatase-like hydrolase/transferase [Myxococcales bacterium]|jgi:arylsulfatase A-like enzyme